jgi:hypothetical protein
MRSRKKRPQENDNKDTTTQTPGRQSVILGYATTFSRADKQSGPLLRAIVDFCILLGAVDALERKA